ncbi:MAG: sulfotransferase [Flavobacteriales bacterium]|nr:sulfotransferase [Flavobacteriales bacterium]
MDPIRTEAFQRNDSLEALLRELNDALGGAEERLAALPDEPPYPTILIIGAPRSGTTLLMQWLAASGLVAFPSNLLSRFYQAPYLGARIQQLIADPRFNYKDELSGLLGAPAEFASEVGKTKGALQPNEFWYFWRRFIPNVDPEWITPEQEDLIDGAGFRRGIAHIQHAFGKPFATKGIILQYNLEALRRALGKVIFVHTRRNAFFNTQSLLQARVKYHGSIDTWFSVKPREYEELRKRDPVEQVAGQVILTQRHIEEQLASMPAEHVLTIDHEAFCADPAAFHAALGAKLKQWGCEWPDAYTGPARFEVSDRVRVDDAMRARIMEACKWLEGAYPSI